MTGRKWSRSTTGKVAECLRQRLQIEVSATTVRRLLLKLDYSLKTNNKCICSGSNEDRDAQFRIIADFREEFSQAGEPVISVDTKKKELIGLFKNPGRIWCREACKVKDHDFRSEALGIASPYGIYDVSRNRGVLVVGKSADTPEFAVNAIATWYEHHGSKTYRQARRLLILADAGGSNGARPRAFKKFLQEKIANRYGLTVRVAHYPTGASKWNPVEHRMFSEITKNWAGRPLETFQTLLNYAAGTNTVTGLTIDGYVDDCEYAKGIRVSDKEFKALNLTRDDQLGKWNYVIEPEGHPQVLIPDSTYKTNNPKATKPRREPAESKR